MTDCSTNSSNSFMKKTLLFGVIVLAIIAAGASYRYFRSGSAPEKVYVAVEGEGKIAAFDPATGRLTTSIDLSVPHEGGMLTFAPHNVQVAPDMKSVWVTANVGGHEGHSAGLISAAHAHEDEGEETEIGEADEVVVIDPFTDRIVKRIPIASGIHLAHVVLTPDSAFAYATAQTEGAIYKINARTFEVLKQIEAPEGSGPHGLRIAPDGKTAYIAMLEGRGLGILDLAADSLSVIPLPGAAVQTAVTPDGKFAAASLFDTRQVAIYEVASGKVSTIQLPKGARGPVQLYPVPDSRFLYVADQGYYFGQPEGNTVYKIALDDKEVATEVKAGSAPHGVAVSPDGVRVYVTNLLSEDVSIIDAASGREIRRVNVGKGPNGVSVWVRPPS
jgi:YVTN family beta-propeller protein